MQQTQAVPAQNGKTCRARACKEEKRLLNGQRRAGVTWELSAGSVTVGDEQWTRLAFHLIFDLEIGIGLDVELFINAKGIFGQGLAVQ